MKIEVFAGDRLAQLYNYNVMYFTCCSLVTILKISQNAVSPHYTRVECIVIILMIIFYLILLIAGSPTETPYLATSANTVRVIELP